MYSSKLRLGPVVKAYTMALAPDGWFSVEDYLSHETGELDPMLFDVRHVLMIRESKKAGEKAVVMRLLRYYRHGLLERKSMGHKFLYKLTEKGISRAVSLRNR